jgi:hypothetical protein
MDTIMFNEYIDKAMQHAQWDDVGSWEMSLMARLRPIKRKDLMYISRKRVEWHAGHIDVQSVPT